MKWQPHKYQKTAAKFVTQTPYGALFMEPGLGKTAVVYSAFSTLRSMGHVKRMLVIAPLRAAHAVWPAEAAKWDEFNRIRVVVAHGKDKAKILAEPHDVTVVNPDGLEWLLGAMGVVKFGEKAAGPGWWWDMLVVDESTRFKNTATKRFKQLKKVLHRFQRRVILTGSPSPNGLLDLFGQLYVMDMGRALGRFITHYRMEFFNPTGFGGYTWEPKPDAERRIYARLHDRVLRMAAEDHLDLPPLVYNNIWVTLPDAAMRRYKQMEELMLTEIDQRLVTAANAAAATLKCRQIANGGAYIDDGTETGARQSAVLHEAKTEACEELVEELSGKPAFIAYEFNHERERLLKKFPDAQWLGGGQTTKQSLAIQQRWNAGQLPVLLAQPQSVAHGLNLQGVNAAVIWYALTWDLEIYEQFIRRVWRQGQKGRVVVHHILARDTIDIAILKSLQAKDRTQRALMDALRAYGTQRRPLREKIRR